MNEENAQNIEQNLMASAEQTPLADTDSAVMPQPPEETTSEESESFSVKVKDEDKTFAIPEDLNEPKKTVMNKKLLYILGAVALIFITVVVVLSQQVSFFKGSLSDPLNPEEDFVFDEYQSDLAGDQLDDTSVPVTDYSYADSSDVPPGLQFDDTLFGSDVDDDVYQVPAPNFGSGELEGYQIPTPAFDTSAYVATANEDGYGLASNTDSDVLTSPEVQGDTGPGVLIAMIPSALYALVRRKRWI